MKRLLAVCIFALAVAVACSAYAEVQNVKVSGDITTRVFSRMGYPDTDTVVAGGQDGHFYNHSYNDDQFIMTTTRLRVDADLTDNVSATIVLNNERDWGISQSRRRTDDGRTADIITANSGANSVNGRLYAIANQDNADEFDVMVEKAYVTLKEFFYQPLTLIIGRQNLWYGRGFIIGYNKENWDPNNAISANEYSTMGTFDAIRAVLDFNPWTLDVVYSTTVNGGNSITGGWVGGPSSEYQRNLLGANLNYKFSEYNAEAEAYYWYDRYNNGEGAAPGQNVAVIQAANYGDIAGDPEERSTHTIGARGEFDPIANMTFYGEVAYQWGKYNPADSIYTLLAPNMTPNSLRKRSAWAIDVGGEYRFSDYAWQPKLGGEYIFYSGENDPWAEGGKYNGWDSMYRGKFDTAIREFIGSVYQTRDAYDPSSGTNQHQFAVDGSVRPIEALEVYARYTYFRLHKALSSSTDTVLNPPTSRSKDLGHEIDVKLTYDYTEDVQFSLLSAWYLPGDYYKDATSQLNSSAGLNTIADTVDLQKDHKSAKTMSEFVGSVKVSF